MNKVNLIGRLTKDIEMRSTTSGTSVARFTLAINRRKKDEADFISCIAWGKTAELMDRYVAKGDRIAVAGRIQTGSYEKDGVKRYTTDVVVEDLEFLEKKKNSEGADATDDFVDVPDDIEGLPF